MKISIPSKRIIKNPGLINKNFFFVLFFCLLPFIARADSAGFYAPLRNGRDIPKFLIYEAVALLLTVIIELAVAYLFVRLARVDKKVLKIISWINLITQPVISILLGLFADTSPIGLLLGEILVVIAEAVILFRQLPAISKFKLFFLSLAANTASFAIGLILFGIIFHYSSFGGSMAKEYNEKLENIDYSQVNAIKSNDPEQCLKLPDASRSSCYRVLAIEKKDPTLCERTFSVDNCLEDIAKKTQDKSFCEGIKNGLSRNTCIGKIILASQNYSLEICESIPTPTSGGFYEDKCYFELARKDKNEQYCLLIGIESKRDGCFSEVAAAKGDLKICERVRKMGSISSSCQANYFVGRGDWDSCVKVVDPVSIDHDLTVFCARKMAIKTGDFSWCEKISKGNMRDNCYHDFATETGNQNACGKIYNKKTKDLCLSSSAGRTGELNPPGCAEFAAGKLRDKCNFYGALTSKDPRYCNNDSADDQKLKCIANLIEEGGSSIAACENFTDSKMRDKCYWRIILGPPQPF